ncbi:MAG: bacillithiol biosynthesis deacetylase BshB1 [Bacteroidia bacterium]|nr:bacillithiol biosynthesis deacetylase BshB1 [Bacteroidia bacterium]NNC85745.1 bacillithiol biosynthesis deacetylase BshB1 [Bacteroidia bacterium]NNM16282.1 bacillithiol biosynthesis deacetylase BshB1 [Bacteroidia bacterium]
MHVDILAIGAHPDDVEISASGTLLKHISLGHSAAIVDLTKGELGTRGNAELRLKEADAASAILGIKERVNLGMADGFFMNDKEHQLRIIEVIRYYKPKIVLANAVKDRHADHGKASKLISDACFYSGLRKIETKYKGEKQTAHRPQAVYHYIQDRYIKPDIIVDISGFIDKKMDSIKAFKSQFFDPNSNEPNTPISSKGFLQSIENRSAEYGRVIGVEYGEPFTVERCAGIDDLLLLK